MAERDSNQKRCCTCKEFLPRERFGPSKQRKDGLRPNCRVCHNKGTAASRARNLEASREASRRWQANNPDKAKAKRERWKQANPGRETFLAARWRANNPDRLADTTAARRAKPEVRMMRSIAQRIRNFVHKKDGASTHKLVGYTGGELRQHLERQFLPGMTWENYGEWHIDHILPLASFHSSSDDAIRRAWSLSNLRPIWAKDNFQKRDKVLFLI